MFYIVMYCSRRSTKHMLLALGDGRYQQVFNHLKLCCNCPFCHTFSQPRNYFPAKEANRRCPKARAPIYMEHRKIKEFGAQPLVLLYRLVVFSFEHVLGMFTCKDLLDYVRLCLVFWLHGIYVCSFKYLQPNLYHSV